MKKVKLILEYEIGEYDEDERISSDLKVWEEVLQQSDVLICDMKILEVRIE
jgi:hypothetical protein